jgi:hypothetical protein
MNAQFDGETFDPALDGKRLTSQLERVRELMKDGKWHSLAYISMDIGGSEASVSARLRDLRKVRFGGHTVERMRVKEGLWVYRLKPDEPMQLNLTGIPSHPFSGCQPNSNE